MGVQELCHFHPINFKREVAPEKRKTGENNG
jgi:hypothetical protein